MDFEVLGPLSLRTPNGVLPVRGQQQRAVLATLLARIGRTVPVDDLLDALWPDSPPRTADHTLHTHVSRLRRTLGVPVVALDGGYRLDATPASTDAGRFDALVRSAGSRPAHEAIPLLTEAVALWKGRAFGGAADLPAVRAEAQRLEELRLQATERLVAALTETGRAPEAVPLAQALTAEAPGRETAWVLLVHALIASGRPADGVTAYLRAADALDELGLLPSAALARAHVDALAPPASAVTPATPTGPPPAPRPASPPRPAPAPGAPAADQADAPGRALRTVPVPTSSFIGREAELAAIDHLLDTARLVTLVGPGGVGKTRLALEALRRRAARHASGTRIVELTTLSDPAAVDAAMVSALGVAADGDAPWDALRRAGGLDVLVLLDNCEHVIDTVAEALAQLLVGERATVLATSRERIGLPGETLLPVAPLPLTGPEPAARRLFLERAAAAGLGPGAAALDDADVDRVVDRLDGLPLAIEMAAARVPLLGLPALAQALDRELGPATELRTPYRGTPERHRTLRAVIAWSEALLDPRERAVFVTWPVFAGPVDAADAEAVLGAARDVVENLVLRSLLIAIPWPDGAVRFRMLHTVRAAVVAGDHAVDEALRRRHAEHFGDVAEQCSRALRGPAEPVAVARITGLAAELRAAHAWGRRYDPSLAASISRALQPYAVNAVDDEVLDWGSRLLTAQGGSADSRDVGVDTGADAHADAHADGRVETAGLLALAARLTFAGELGAAAARARDALSLADDDVTRLHALEVLTDTSLYDGRLAECRAWGEQMADLAVAARDPHYLAMAAGSLSLAHAYDGDAEGALAALADCRERFAGLTQAPAPTDEGWLAYTEGEMAIDADPAAALRLLERAIVLADRAGNRYLGGVARVSATSLRARHGEPAAALDAFAAVIRWWLDNGDRTHLVTTLRNVVDVLVQVGLDAAAAELWGTVGHDRPSRSFGDERARLDANRAVLASRLDPDILGERNAAGAARDVDDAARAVLAVVDAQRCRR